MRPARGRSPSAGQGSLSISSDSLPAEAGSHKGRCVASGFSRKACNRDLEDRLLEQPRSAERGVRVLGKENREPAGRHRHPAVRRIVIEADVARLVERRGRRAAQAQRTPANLLVSVDRQLNIDVAAMRLEPRGRASAPLGVIDGEIQPIAVDDVPPGRQRAEIAGRREVEGGRKARVQVTVAIALRRACPGSSGSHRLRRVRHGSATRPRSHVRTTPTSHAITR